jgi:hypothetical protein
MIFRRLLSLPRRIRYRRWTRKIERFRARHRQRPAPLPLCIQLQRCITQVFENTISLAPPGTPLIGKGECLRDSELANMFRGVDIGVWSLTLDIIDWLVDFLYRERPRLVLEFGSGVSTACLCVILHRIYGTDGFRLLSLDQDLSCIGLTLERLQGLDGRSSCRVVHVPLTPAVVDGRSTFFYDLDQLDREHFNWLGKAEFVLIDGPFADGPCRYGTLPKVRAHLAPGARFVMDDALREKELVAGSLWGPEGIVVQGVLTLGQGLMVGIVP